MTEKLQVYKCEVCGNIVEVIHSGKGQLVCCGKPMVLMEEKTEDQGKEKYVPVVERSREKVGVKVGSIPHPMQEGHYIEWIEIIADAVTQRKFLSAGERPEAEFTVKAENISVREYCNIHGLWKS